MPVRLPVLFLVCFDGCQPAVASRVRRPPCVSRPTVSACARSSRFVACTPARAPAGRAIACTGHSQVLLRLARRSRALACSGGCARTGVALSGARGARSYPRDGDLPQRAPARPAGYSPVRAGRRHGWGWQDAAYCCRHDLQSAGRVRPVSRRQRGCTAHAPEHRRPPRVRTIVSKDSPDHAALLGALAGACVRTSTLDATRLHTPRTACTARARMHYSAPRAPQRTLPSMRSTDWTSSAAVARVRGDARARSSPLPHQRTHMRHAGVEVECAWPVCHSAEQTEARRCDIARRRRRACAARWPQGLSCVARTG
jgi:hypothetical protein